MAYVGGFNYFACAAAAEDPAARRDVGDR